MKSGKEWRAILLAVSVAGLVLGATFFSAGSCGGGGGMEIDPNIASSQGGVR